MYNFYSAQKVLMTTESYANGFEFSYEVFNLFTNFLRNFLAPFGLTSETQSIIFIKSYLKKIKLVLRVILNK